MLVNRLHKSSAHENAGHFFHLQLLHKARFKEISITERKCAMTVVHFI
jgi:hypothetical protein